MHAAGLQAIEESKRKGLWDTMADVDALIIPDDLFQALQTEPAAYDYFSSSAVSYRRNVLRWIKTAKKPETRANRIQATVDLSAKQEKIPHLS